MPVKGGGSRRAPGLEDWPQGTNEGQVLGWLSVFWTHPSDITAKGKQRLEMEAL